MQASDEERTRRRLRDNRMSIIESMLSLSLSLSNSLSHSNQAFYAVLAPIIAIGDVHQQHTQKLIALIFPIGAMTIGKKMVVVAPFAITQCSQSHITYCLAIVIAIAIVVVVVVVVVINRCLSNARSLSLSLFLSNCVALSLVRSLAYPMSGDILSVCLVRAPTFYRSVNRSPA